jgi:replicative DNA helicase
MEGMDLVRREQHLERPLPSSEDSERAVLGGILLNNDLIAQAVEKLKPEDFYSPLNRRVYAAMIELFRQAKPADPILILEEMKKTGPVDAIGGVSTIANLSFGLPHFSSLKEYVKTVAEKSEQRELVRICNRITTRALAEEENHAELITYAEQEIFSLTNKPTDHEPELIQVLADESVTEHARMQKEGITVTGFKTGLLDLDDKTGGFKNGNLILLAARPSMGKTALLTQTMFDGLEPEAVGLFFSLEMTKEEITDRLICQNAEVNLWAYHHNKIRQIHWQAIAESHAAFTNKLLYIDDTPSLSAMQMLARARRIKAKHKRLDIIGVDHIGLMGSAGKERSRYDKVTNISGELKGIARTLGCPLVALSQLSRAPEIRNPPKPLMSDLRETGALEQDADVVIFVYREDYYEKLRTEKNQGVGELIIAKQRNGPTETVKVNWVKEHAKFSSLEYD